jgi:cell pole-organizing protein PopZ
VNKEDKKTQDMSIEEILKSIKGVINERKQLNSTDNDEDILELTEIMSDKDKEESSESFDADDKFNPANEEPLISPKFASETSDILKDFAHTIKDKHLEAATSPKNALEELIIEMLRPELSKWLNENLPVLVKQLVEREIKKLMPNNKR